MSNDDIGNRGEAIFRVLITRPHRRNGIDIPLFAVTHLGEKWQTVDFLLELKSVSGLVVPFCFVQVKATRQGYRPSDSGLKTKVSATDVRRIAHYPAPTYIVGIDENNETGFIISANGEATTGLKHLGTNFPIDASTREQLWQEVLNFWATPVQPKLQSVFVDTQWR